MMPFSPQTFVARSPFGEMRVTVEGERIIKCIPASGEASDEPKSAEEEHTEREHLERLLSLKERLPETQVPRHDRYPELWREIWRIPFGETVTYSELTRRLGLPATHIRAVARAVGANDLCLLVPCHRVISKDGSLGGYKWGTSLKAKILAYEQSLVS